MSVSVKRGIIGFITILSFRGVSNLKVSLSMVAVRVMVFVVRVSVLLHNVLVTNYVLSVSNTV